VLNNKYLGQRCFVLGNGSSLADVDLHRLKHENVIVMNAFHLHEQCDSLKPIAYCRGENGASFDTEERVETISAYMKGIKADAFFFSSDVEPVIRSDPHQYNRRQIYFVKHYQDITQWSIKKVSLDLTKTIPRPPDSGVLSLMIALAFGCSPIYLLGFDYDRLAYRKEKKHFYKSNQLSSLPDKRPYLDILEPFVNLWRTHYCLQTLATARLQQIVNLTEESFLDVYPKKSLSSVL